jgi:hypothetical protein
MSDHPPQPISADEPNRSQPVDLNSPPNRSEPVDEATTAPPHPRSIKRRLAQQAVATTPSRVRSQPLAGAQPAPRRVREPLLIDWEPEPMQGPWRARPLVIGLAVLAWLVALGLLVTDMQQLAQLGLAPRLLVPLVWGLAAALVFVPLQLRLALPGISWQGIVGYGLLGYLLAFVPAPTSWLLDLPDLPVYLLLFFALFYAISATMLPLTYLTGQRFYKLRIHRLDVGRARRQAYEIGLLIVITLVMAALRVLSPATFGLLLLVMILTEALLLSQVQPEG